MDLTSTSIVIGGVSAVTFAMALFVRSRRARQRRDAAALAAAVDQRIHLPASLHPVIDPDTCIGSLSCITACPEGDILGVVGGSAKLIAGANCIGHGRCAAECPVDAIKLVIGTSERGVDLPEIDTYFESSRPGIHVVGELGGMGLIRNAITQGLQVARHLKSQLRTRGSDRLDVAIVGGGPAGLATALGCRAAGLSFRVLEQDTLGGTISHYPRQKVVMTEPVKLPLYGRFGKSQISKEELLATWKKILAKTNISIDEGVRVERIDGVVGAFTVRTSQGPISARRVVLATGRRGTPRKLGVPGEDLPKVTYRLLDPEQYGGKRVLVVGGGDSALEAAIQLAAQPDVEVVLAHRSPQFTKCRDANKRKIAALASEGQLHLLMSTQVTVVREDAVDLNVDGQAMRLPNDYLIVAAGGELPLSFLEKMGVEVKRHHGKEITGEKSNELGDQRGNKRLGRALFVVGCLIIAALVIRGWEYYLLPRAARLRSPEHDHLRPAGLWGHGVGVVATAFMLSNFFYAVRKRWRRVKGSGSIRNWLTFHIFVGVMSPIVIAFHAAFQSNNLLATATYGSLLIVVGTGLVGRFLYGLVPSAGGKVVELNVLRNRWERMQREIEPLLAHVANPGPARALLATAASEVPAGGSLIAHFVRMPFAWLARQRGLAQVRRLFDEPDRYREFRRQFVWLARLRTQVGFSRSLKRLLSGWRVFHVVLSIFLVLLIAGHIGVSLYLGYRWILS